MNVFYKKIWNLCILSSTLLALNFGLAMAQSGSDDQTHFGGNYHVYLPANVSASLKSEVTAALNKVLAGQKAKFILFQSDDAINDASALNQTIGLNDNVTSNSSANNNPDGVLLVLDRLSAQIDLQMYLQNAAKKSIPVVLVGWQRYLSNNTLPITAFVTSVDLMVKTAANQLMKENRNDVLCVYSVEAQSCEALQNNFVGNVLTRRLDLTDSPSAQWATTISAMTQNPRIRTVVAADIASIPVIQAALKLLADEFGLISLDYTQESFASVAGKGFAIDPQWYLQTMLAVQTLVVRAERGQLIWVTVPLAPRIVR